MSSNNHSVTVAAPAAGKRKGTTVSLRNLIVAELDKELVVTQEGTKTKTGMTKHGKIVSAVTITFEFDS